VDCAFTNKMKGMAMTESGLLIRIGTPAQGVDVMVSTVNSETWAAEPGGCSNSKLQIPHPGHIWH
jgi:hypothetical protein